MAKITSLLYLILKKVMPYLFGGSGNFKKSANLNYKSARKTCRRSEVLERF